MSKHHLEAVASPADYNFERGIPGWVRIAANRPIIDEIDKISRKCRQSVDHPRTSL